MFRPVNTKVDFPQMEENVLSFWQAEDIFKKSIESRSQENEYVFYDGPPFATGLPHFGHLVPGTIKDAIPRYHTMKGKRVRRGFGWDCHGLPVEYEIGKDAGHQWSFCHCQVRRSQVQRAVPLDCPALYQGVAEYHQPHGTLGGLGERIPHDGCRLHGNHLVGVQDPV